MKSASVLTVISLLSAAVRGSVLELDARAADGYLQNPSGNASFTFYAGCGNPACGETANGFTAAMSQLTFGAPPGLGPGDACGRCFMVNGTADPFSPAYTGPFFSIVLKTTDLCPVTGNQQWCGQTVGNPANQFGQPVHFDLCQDSGAANAFFPPGHGALLGVYQEVSCSLWSGTDGSPLWNTACLAGENATNWPTGVGCGNQGTPPS